MRQRLHLHTFPFTMTGDWEGVATFVWPEQEDKSDFWGASDIFEERKRFYQSVIDQKQVSAISSWASEIFEERQRYVYSQKTRRQKTLPLVCTNRIRVAPRVFRKTTFFELRSAFYIYGAIGWLEPTKKIQHYRPINGLGMAIWSFDLIYIVKTAEIGAKIFKINKMAENHFSR